MAGPIERASHLLPQIRGSRSLTGDDTLRGMWLIAQGLAKKVIIADNTAAVANAVFALDDPSGPLVVIGAVAFALQIYGDFSGYTDIARGTDSPWVSRRTRFIGFQPWAGRLVGQGRRPRSSRARCRRDSCGSVRC